MEVSFQKVRSAVVEMRYDAVRPARHEGARRRS